MTKLYLTKNVLKYEIFYKSKICSITGSII